MNPFISSARTEVAVLSFSPRIDRTNRWSFRIPSLSLLLVVAAALTVSALVHLPLSWSTSEELVRVVETSVRSFTVPEFAALDDWIRRSANVAEAAVHHSDMSLINSNAATVMQVTNVSVLLEVGDAVRVAGNATHYDFTDRIVVQAFTNASVVFGTYWYQEFVASGAAFERRLFADQSRAKEPNLIFAWVHQRRDGLCAGMLAPVAAGVAYRGNCSSCALAFSVRNLSLSSKRGEQFSSWTTNFSSVQSLLSCRNVSGRRYCPQAPSVDFKETIAAFSSESTFTTSCFGMPYMEHSLRLQSSLSVPEGMSVPDTTVTLRLPMEEYLAAAIREFLRPEFAAVFWQGAVVLPIQGGPALLANVSRNRNAAALCSMRLEGPCFPTVALVHNCWPVMHGAMMQAHHNIVSATNLTSSQPSSLSSSATTFWMHVSGGTGARLLVWAAQVERRYGLVVAYATEEALLHDLAASQERAAKRTALMLGLVLGACLVMVVAAGVLVNASREVLSDVCMSSLGDALDHRIRLGANLHTRRLLNAFDDVLPSMPEISADTQPAGTSLLLRGSRLCREIAGGRQRSADALPVQRGATTATDASAKNLSCERKSNENKKRSEKGLGDRSPLQRVVEQTFLLQAALAFKETRDLIVAAFVIESTLGLWIGCVPSNALARLQRRCAMLQDDVRHNESTCWSTMIEHMGRCFGRMWDSMSSLGRFVVTQISRLSVARDAGYDDTALTATGEKPNGSVNVENSSFGVTQRFLIQDDNNTMVGKSVVVNGRHDEALLDAQQYFQTFRGRSFATTAPRDIVKPLAPQQAPPSGTFATPTHHRRKCTAAFVLFDLGPCALDDADTVAAYLRMMRTVMSIFGAFGGCLERVEASRIVGTFNVHLPCAAFCEQAVACAARIAKYMEEQMDVWMYEESFTLRGFGSEYLVLADADDSVTTKIFNVSFQISSLRSACCTTDYEIGTERKREGVTVARRLILATDVWGRAEEFLIPFCRAKRAACVATQDVVDGIATSGNVSLGDNVEVLAMDFVYAPKIDQARRVERIEAHKSIEETPEGSLPNNNKEDSAPLILYGVGTARDAVDRMRVAIENRTVEKALTLMSMRLYEEADATLTMYPWRTDTVNYLQHYTKRQLQLPVEERLFYGTVYNERLRWQLEMLDVNNN